MIQVFLVVILFASKTILELFRITRGPFSKNLVQQSLDGNSTGLRGLKIQPAKPLRKKRGVTRLGAKFKFSLVFSLKL